MKTKKVYLPLRVEPELIYALDRLTAKESERLGFHISRTALVRKILWDFIKYPNSTPSDECQ
jgi:hypothetical protein